MADVKEEITDNLEDVSRKRGRNFGAGLAAAAALIGAGYMIGQHHAESRSSVSRLKKQLGL